MGNASICYIDIYVYVWNIFICICTHTHHVRCIQKLYMKHFMHIKHSICTDILYMYNLHMYHDVCVVCCSVLQCVAVCCSVLQYVVVCCSVLQCVLVDCRWVAGCCRVLQGVVVCCNVLQCVLVCSSVLQHVAVCCVQPWDDFQWPGYIPDIHQIKKHTFFSIAQ